VQDAVIATDLTGLVFGSFRSLGGGLACGRV